MPKSQPIAKARYCHFCVNGITDIDYKEPKLLTRFLSSYAKIVPRRKSGVCATHQRRLAVAVKHARFMAILPYTTR